MNKAAQYYTTFVSLDGNLVFAEDFVNHADAVRSAVEWQEAGCTTETLELSDSALYDTAPDHYNDVAERFAY